MDETDQETFAELRPNYYATSVVKMSGLPNGTAIQNTGEGTPYNLPPLPATYGLTPTPVPDLWLALYGGVNAESNESIQQNIQRSIESLATVGTLPTEFEGFEIFSNHTPFEMWVSGQEIARGFYRRLNSLQGSNRTFFNGAAFQTNDSSLIWGFTEKLLPSLVS